MLDTDQTLDIRVTPFLEGSLHAQSEEVNT